MSVVRVAALAVACLVLAERSARADGFVTPFLGFNFGGASANCISLTNCEDKRLNLGLSFGSMSGILGFEEDISYAPHFFSDANASQNAVLTAMSNLLVIVPAGPIRPYGLIGIGLIRTHFQANSSALDFTSNALGHDIGGGINIFFTPGVGLRGDLRHLRTFKDFNLFGLSTDKIEFWRGSAGLTFRF
jgi:outer membrane protein with beta-barrel domain